MEDEYIHDLIYYLQLPERINKLNDKILNCRKKYYATHSFIGTAIYDRESDTYQRARSVEYYVFDLIGKQNAYQIQLKRLLQRFKLFNEELSENEQNKLRSDIYSDLGLLNKAIEWVKELEEYIRYQNEALELKYETKLLKIPTTEDLNKMYELESELEALFG